MTCTHTASPNVEWLPIAAAAERLGIHPRTVERRAKAGTLESRRGDDGRVEVGVPASPGAAPDTPPAGEGASVVDPDRQLVLGIAAMKAADRQLGELRLDLTRSRRTALAAWVTAATVGLASAGVAVWVASSWTAERGRLEAQLVEQRGTAAAADRLVDRLQVDLDAERLRLAGLETDLDDAAAERRRLVSALEEAHRRGDGLREDLIEADARLAEERARHLARQDAAGGWLARLVRPLASAGARQAPDGAPDDPTP